MTELETKNILGIIRTAYPQAYKNMTRQEGLNLLSLWHQMLMDADYGTVQDAVKQYIATDTRGYAPTIGQVVALVAKQAANERTYDISPDVIKYVRKLQESRGG